MAQYVYEDKFSFPLWEQIKKRAQEKDISYFQAMDEVVPEFERTIRYRDEKFENEAIGARYKEMVAFMTKLMEKQQKQGG